MLVLRQPRGSRPRLRKCLDLGSQRRGRGSSRSISTKGGAGNSDITAAVEECQTLSLRCLCEAAMPVLCQTKGIRSSGGGAEPARRSH